MKVLVLIVELKADYAHSLKEKRMVVRSITQKLKNKFNISVNEVDTQDLHNLITIGISAICQTNAIADSTYEKILNFIECNTDAEMVNIEKEVIEY